MGDLAAVLKGKLREVKLGTLIILLLKELLVLSKAGEVCKMWVDQDGGKRGNRRVVAAEQKKGDRPVTET